MHSMKLSYRHYCLSVLCPFVFETQRIRLPPINIYFIQLFKFTCSNSSRSMSTSSRLFTQDIQLIVQRALFPADITQRVHSDASHCRRGTTHLLSMAGIVRCSDRDIANGFPLQRSDSGNYLRQVGIDTDRIAYLFHS